MKKNFSLTILISILSLVLLTNCGKKEESAPAPEAETKTTEPATTDTAADDNAKGKELFAQCTSCHGDTGAGDGPAGAALKPPPRNFKAPAAEWKNGKTLEGITKTLKEGIPGSSMASYAYLSEEESSALAKYVLELAK
ncbi:MAG: cytochrome c [Leptospiraceae bacterium]|nr:cytochrome c [Leptospiraceae bacterium]MCP5512843.1 cytochrome c [Leptospiraceae bacterium]